ncbi:hypothetical protein E1B28_002225 [Marasmius oreades]|uniref:SET domain-containing protein n=1 Tax=Marasmius oreades TaxID=181124 RepID=A0A9P7ULB7_9AGAR|nr:uncharacterized protein E1B28_002225 [Marasmius oreades]KAG7086255.1 hypothetical protein E1B28_002225 [Marasmius oreades]
MLIEERNGPTSPWYHYLRSLPRKRVDLPILWSLALHNEDREEVEDKKTALAWLRGTEVERQLHSGMGSGSSMSLDDLNGFFNGFVLPITKNTNIEEFYRAYSFVSSRAFVVDAYHGLAMVPVADAFNHATYNHVQLESEFDVCPECGSVQECVHDKDQGENTHDPGVAPVFEEDSNEDEKYYLMTTTTHIPVGTKEIFNTYGSRLTNAALMVQYGFILDENEKDYIEFDLRDVVEEEGMDKPVGIGRGSGGIGEPLEGLEEVTYHSEDFQINSDGRMSTALFALLGGDPGKAIQLCQTRLARFTQDDVGTVLDELPSSRWRTRMVGMEVLAEQGILRSCMTGWQDYLGL